MARNKRPSTGDRVSDYINSINIPTLKRACIIRGIPFPRVTRLGVHGLNSWLYKNYENRIDVTLLEKYDTWMDDALEISGPVPLELRMAFFGEDEKGNVKKERRDVMLMGVNKSKSEIAAFKPKRGSKKELTFQLMHEGKGTKEVIKEVMAVFPEAKEGSIKSWCSQARKVIKVKKELENEA